MVRTSPITSAQAARPAATMMRVFSNRDGAAVPAFGGTRASSYLVIGTIFTAARASTPTHSSQNGRISTAFKLKRT